MSMVIIPNDVTCHRLSPRSFDCPEGSIRNAAIPSSEQLAADKLQHQHRAHYAQPNTAATSVTIAVHLARFAGTLKQLVAGSIAAAIGDSTVTVDLRKNGTTVLSSVLTLDNGATARAQLTATLNPSQVDYVAGDWFDLVITATAGTGTLPTGLAAAAVFNEGSQ